MTTRLLGLALAAILASSGAVACNGTTGDNLLSFSAYASGAQGAGEAFTAGDFTVQLTAAKMHIGAVYFDEAPPGTGSEGPECIASGVYAAQVPGPVDVDLLSDAPQEFSVYGTGTQDTALSWQVWLTDGDINEVNTTDIVQLEGTATGTDGKAVSFGGVVTINSNRSHGSSDPAQPGNSPICKSRIVQIGGVDISFRPGGTLYVTVDPRVWFTQQAEPIDFTPGQLPLVTDPNCDPDTASITEPQAYGLTPETPPPASQTCGGSGQACCPGSGSGGTCLGSLTCTSGLCGPTYCVPNSSFLTGADPGAAAGVDLFSEIISSAAFSVSYEESP